MKIRITESRLKDIIRRVICEQVGGKTVSQMLEEVPYTDEDQVLDTEMAVKLVRENEGTVSEAVEEDVKYKLGEDIYFTSDSVNNHDFDLSDGNIEMSGYYSVSVQGYYRGSTYYNPSESGYEISGEAVITEVRYYSKNGNFFESKEPLSEVITVDESRN